MIKVLPDAKGTGIFTMTWVLDHPGPYFYFKNVIRSPHCNCPALLFVFQVFTYFKKSVEDVSKTQHAYENDFKFDIFYSGT